MEIVGQCKRCGAPMFWNVDVDANGYKVRSLRCWNGHYRDLTVLNLVQVEDREAQSVKFIAHKCPECGKDFNFVQKVPSNNGEPTLVQGVCRSCGKEYSMTLYTRSNKKTEEKAKRKKS
jgi:hypothetical protein